jgi:hypothetical protein
MGDIVAAVERAGRQAGNRQRVIDAYFAAHSPRAGASEPFWLERRSGSRVVYDPI